MRSNASIEYIQIQRLVRWLNCMDIWIQTQTIGWMDYLRIFSVI